MKQLSIEIEEGGSASVRGPWGQRHEPETTGEAHLSPSARWALGSLSLAMLMPSLDTSIANAGLPTLAAAFGASFQGAQWVVLSYLLAITTTIVSVGRLGDVIGRRRLLLSGIVLFTVASLLCGVAPKIEILIAARAAQGLGAAVMMALTVAFVSETVPKDRVGSAMGILGTMSAIGTTLGPSLGGLLISWLGWRSIFLVNVPAGVLLFLLSRRSLPVERLRPSAERAAFDHAGTLLLAMTLGAYALAMTLGHGQFGWSNLGFFAIAVSGALLFVAHESRVKSPLIRLAMLRNRALAAGLPMSAIVSTVMMTTLVVGPFYLTRSLGLDAAAGGLALSAGPLVAALMAVPAGRIVDRFGAARMTIAGLTGIASGATILSLLPSSSGIIGYLAPVAIMTASYALFQVANNTVVMTSAGTEQRGIVSGLLNLSRNLGLITGASVMGAVFALASAAPDVATAHPDAVAAGMRTTFAAATALLAAGLVIAWRARSAGQTATEC